VASVPIGDALVLTARVDNYTNNAGVSWIVSGCDGPACGTLTWDQGVDPLHTVRTYAAPSTPQQAVAGTRVTITVTSVEDPGKSASATVTLTRPPIDFEERTLSAGRSPSDVVVTDINGDGSQDLAVADLGDAAAGDAGGVSTLIGVGDGTFQAATHFPTGEHPIALAAGDLNLDGHKDLVVVSRGNDEQDGVAGVEVLLGAGDGSFRKPVPAVLDTEAFGGDVLAISDFNGDGKADVAVAGNGDPVTGESGSIVLLAGNGDGRLQAPHRLSAGEKPVAIGAADLNGDGKLDLAITERWSTSGTQPTNVTILLGDGTGAIEPTPAPRTAHQPTSMTMGDLNSDGLTDLIIIGVGITRGISFSAFRSGVDVLLADQDQWARQSQDIQAMLAHSSPTPRFPPPPHSVRVGDFNGDAYLDIALITGASVTLVPGNGDGTFGGEKLFPTTLERVLEGRLMFVAGSGPTAMEIGDFDGNGKPDLVVANAGSNDVSVLLNTTP